ncbi:C-methyltransferase [alpha proteobacterium HIMB114]|nr:C-methyltransferase [alpha proteobacterium HIMB114]
MPNNKTCKICRNKLFLFYKIDKFPLKTINNFYKNKEIKLKDLSLYFCNKCKNITTYPKIQHSILYGDFLVNDIFYKNLSKKKSTKLIKEKKIFMNSRVLEISKNKFLNPEVFKKKKITFNRINFQKIFKKFKLLSNDSFDYIFCYDVIGNTGNIKHFLKCVKKKINQNGKIFIYHHYGPSLVKNLNIDRIYFEHKDFLSLNAIKEIADKLNLHIIDFNFIENKNFFEVVLSKSFMKLGSNNIKKTLVAERKFTKKNIVNFQINLNLIINKFNKFIIKNKNCSIYGFGASIGALPLIKIFNLDDKFSNIFDDNPLQYNFRLSNKVNIKVNKFKKFKKENKIIIILAPRYKSSIIKKLEKKICLGDYIISLVPKFNIYQKRRVDF